MNQNHKYADLIWLWIFYKSFKIVYFATVCTLKYFNLITLIFFFHLSYESVCRKKIQRNF